MRVLLLLAFAACGQAGSTPPRPTGGPVERTQAAEALRLPTPESFQAARWSRITCSTALWIFCSRELVEIVMLSGSHELITSSSEGLNSYTPEGSTKSECCWIPWMPFMSATRAELMIISPK